MQMHVVPINNKMSIMALQRVSTKAAGPKAPNFNEYAMNSTSNNLDNNINNSYDS
jgi:hypothetical protein